MSRAKISSLGVWLNDCLIFSKFQPSVAYKSVVCKSVAYKSVAYKSVAYKSVAYKSVAYKKTCIAESLFQVRRKSQITANNRNNHIYPKSNHTLHDKNIPRITSL